MASGVYVVFKGDVLEKQVDVGSGGDTIKVALMTNSHAFTNTDDVWGDVSANEISGAGYTAGGATLGGQAVTEATATKWDGDDTAWTSATFSAWHCVIVDITNTSSLICSIDFGGEQAVASGTFTIQWNAAGIITLT